MILMGSSLKTRKINPRGRCRGRSRGALLGTLVGPLVGPLASSASGGSPHRGASFKVENALLLHEKRARRTAKVLQSLRPSTEVPNAETPEKQLF